MEKTKINIDEIKPAPYNPRVMPPREMQKLEKSIKTYGLADPIIIDLTDNNTIISGHQRYEVLQKLGKEDLTLIKHGDIGLVLDTQTVTIKDKNDQKSMNLAFNRIRGEWDFNLLDDVLTDLTSDGYDMDLTGFDDYELIEMELDNMNLEPTTESDEDDGMLDLNFSDGTNEDTYISNIHFNNQKQRRTFIEWLGTLREADPEKNISTAIIEYLRNHIKSDEEKVEKYMILHSNKEEKEEYDRLIKQLRESNRYQGNPFIELIKDDR